MKLFIDMEPVWGVKLQRDDLLKAHSQHISTAEADLGVIDDIVKHANLGQKIEKRRVINKGREAVDGARDGKLVQLVKKYTGKGEGTSTAGAMRTMPSEPLLTM